MLRSITLTFTNEFRLLARDPIGLFMLLLAPLVIIAVAGFSLSALYGAGRGGSGYTLPVVDDDRGPIAQAIKEALQRRSMLRVVDARNLDQARAIVNGRDRSPLAIIIPSGTSTSIENGASANLELYVDPLKRVELAPIEFQIGELCRHLSITARRLASSRFAATAGDLRSRIDKITTDLQSLQATLTGYQRRLETSRAQADRRLRDELRQQLRTAVAAQRADLQSAIDNAIAQARSSITAQLSDRRDAMVPVQKYLIDLQASRTQFEQWFATLQSAAGSHASAISPPPAFPTPPSQATLAVLTQPIHVDFQSPRLPDASTLDASLTRDVWIKLPPPPSPPQLPLTQLHSELEALAPTASPAIPGILGWIEKSASGGALDINAFDQYVPGFGITFLLIGMLMGLSMGLIDERDWGTLARLRVSGASLSGILLGKLAARFLVGFGQMIALLAFGYWLFGVSLGHNPALLLFPSAAIAFAAAAFGLIIACVARTHDSVMPVGTVTAMAMSAIGGCWWPLDFEPAWMRAFAHLLPTTWTMLAFNNLMIRNLSPLSAIKPSLAAAAIGLTFLVIGLAAASRIYD